MCQSLGEDCLLLLFHLWMLMHDFRPFDLNYWIKLQQQQPSRRQRIRAHDREMRIKAPRGRIAMGRLMMSCWRLSV